MEELDSSLVQELREKSGLVIFKGDLK